MNSTIAARSSIDRITTFRASVTGHDDPLVCPVISSSTAENRALTLASGNVFMTEFSSARRSVSRRGGLRTASTEQTMRGGLSEQSRAVQRLRRPAGASDITVQMIPVLFGRLHASYVAEEAWLLMRTELVGREREPAALVEHFESALAAHPRVVLCRGEPGIGKSRMAEELTGPAARRGMPVAWGPAAESSGAPPYWSWRQVLRGVSASVDVITIADELRLTPRSHAVRTRGVRLSRRSGCQRLE